jgi:signal transduction histidine kinase/ligand-binding sensor domain-containing protein
MRFDGTRFEPWKLPDDQATGSLLAARDGSLWAGTITGLVHIHAGHTDLMKGLSGRINTLLQDRAGAIWLVRSRIPDKGGPLCKVSGTTVHCYGTEAGIPCRYAEALIQDRQGDFLLGSDAGVCRWNPRGGASYFPADIASRNLQSVNAFATYPDGSWLVGFIHSGTNLGLQRVTGKNWSTFKADGLDGSALSVDALLFDHKGGLWIGTDNDGIYHVSNGIADHLTAMDGLTSDSVATIFEDREGDVWIGTIGGLDRLRERSVVSYSTREGLVSDQSASVLALRDGSVLISNSRGLSILRNGKITLVAKKDGLPGDAVTSLFQDRSGKVWVGVDNDLTVYQSGRFALVRKPDGSPLGVIRGLAEDAQHDIWALAVGRPYHLYHIRDGRFLDEAKAPVDPVLMLSDPHGAIWLQTRNGGLATLRGGTLRYLRGTGERFGQMIVGGDGRILGASRHGLYRGFGGSWTVLSSDNGLPCDGVQSMIYDGRGALWLQQSCGLSVVDMASLNAFWAHRVSKPTVKVLDTTDGARPGAGVFTPNTARSPDGRLWFATDGVLLSVDPSHLQTNPLPPPVHVEQIVADHVAHPVFAGSAISLAPLTHDVEIDYSGLSFVTPQKVQYRYQLIGLDRGWQDVGTRKSAFYMNLPPGDYVFQVKASNNDGVWSPAGDSMRFTIAPAFYQTLWFECATAAAAAALLWLTFAVRLRSATAQVEARLSERQAERLRIARELHDTLLQGFHGLMAQFQVVANAIPPAEPTHAMMETVLDRADAILVESRDRVRDLRSEEDGASPLGDELKRIAFTLERDGSAPIEIAVMGESRPLKPDVHRELLAIAREALRNAGRHANAAYIRCELRFTSSSVVLSCADDGVGIDAEILARGSREGHWGLSGMRERARQIGSRLYLRNAAPGTVVEVRVPGRLAYAAAAHGVLAQWILRWWSTL